VHFVAGLALSACFWTSRAELGWWHAFERTAAAVSTEHSVDVSQLTSTRSEFWRAAAQHAMQMPWLGHGPDAYRFITPKLDGQQPHNFLLQFWLDLGLLGAVPVAILVGAVLWMSWKNMRATSDSDLGPWTALFTALLALGLLDGVFYHVLTLLPAAIAFGVMLRAGVANEPAAVTRVSRTVVTVGLSGAVALLAVHSWLFHRLVVAPPPENPNATAARVLRAFPSTTFGLWRWLDQWQQGDLETALVWTRWAQAHATNPALFHVRAAQYLQARGETAAALEELRAAEAKAHWTSRPGIAALRQSMLNSR
jgi:O-antigen ligase